MRLNKKHISKIDKIGNILVKCNLKCEGILNKPERGIIPRCLNLDFEERNNKLGCIVVGINPGTPNKDELRYFKEEYPVNYEKLKKYFKEKILHKEPYYNQTRKLKRQLGIKGSILWTDLCKCQSKKKNTNPPVQTFRTCINKFLEKELKLFPNVPIIALGNYSFNYISMRYSERFVIGVPHPSGKFSSKQFETLFKKDKLKEKWKKMSKMKTDKNENVNCIRMFPKIHKKLTSKLSTRTATEVF